MTSRTTTRKLARLAASVAAVVADCRKANRRLTEIKISGRGGF